MFYAQCDHHDFLFQWRSPEMGANFRKLGAQDLQYSTVEQKEGYHNMVNSVKCKWCQLLHFFLPANDNWADFTMRNKYAVSLNCKFMFCIMYDSTVLLWLLPTHTTSIASQTTAHRINPGPLAHVIHHHIKSNEN